MLVVSSTCEILNQATEKTAININKILIISNIGKFDFGKCFDLQIKSNNKFQKKMDMIQ